MTLCFMSPFQIPWEALTKLLRVQSPDGRAATRSTRIRREAAEPGPTALHSFNTLATGSLVSALSGSQTLDTAVPGRLEQRDRKGEPHLQNAESLSPGKYVQRRDKDGIKVHNREAGEGAPKAIFSC